MLVTDLGTSTINSPVYSASTTTFHQRGEPHEWLGDGGGRPSSAGAARDKSPPSPPAAPAPAPGGQAVTTANSGGGDDDDIGPNTFSHKTSLEVEVFAPDSHATHRRSQSVSGVTASPAATGF